MMSIVDRFEKLMVPYPSVTEESPLGWVPYVLRFVRRRWATMLAGMLAILALALTYMIVATPKYTATTTILIDLRHANPFRQQPIVSDAQTENTVIESQVQVLQEPGLLRDVVRRLDLPNDPQFRAIGPGIVGSVLGLVNSLTSPFSGAPSAQQREEVALDGLIRLVAVKRIGVTSLIEISVKTPDRDLSARIANGVTAAYVNDQLGVVGATSRQASDWLRNRTTELRDQAVAADRAVQEYKVANNIVDTDRGLLNEQALGELSTALTTARGQLAAAQAKYDRVATANANRLIEGTLAEALDNRVMDQLRNRYLDASRRDSDLSSRYGPNHVAAVNARREMADLQRSIQNELSRIAETYKSDLEIARANAASIERQLAGVTIDSAATNANRIMLRALQSSADSYRSIYENFLQRYTQAVQDQSFPISDARVVSTAVPPLKKSDPKPLLVLGIGGVLGILFGMGCALVQDTLDRGLRTASQVKSVTGHDCIGLLPRCTGLPRGVGRGIGADPAHRQLATTPGLFRQIADAPGSGFAEAVRGVAMRTVWRQTPGTASQLIGCVSVGAGEGTSTLAANLAHAFAESGYRTILVDLDLRNQSLTKQLAPQNAGGAAEVAAGGASVAQLVWTDPQSRLAFLPASAGASVAQPMHVLARSRIGALLANLRENYERVVIDLPPIGMVADATALSDQLDGFLLALRWGKVDGDELMHELGSFRGGADKLLGIVLTQVDPRQMRRF